MTLQIENKINFNKQQYRCLSLYLVRKSKKQIGKILDISPSTVETYLSRVRAALKVETNGELTEKLCYLGQLTRAVKCAEKILSQHRPSRTCYNKYITENVSFVNYKHVQYKLDMNIKSYLRQNGYIKTDH
jgi:DNA-binding CsgD family transcriptional regulator